MLGWAARRQQSHALRHPHPLLLIPITTTSITALSQPRPLAHRPLSCSACMMYMRWMADDAAVLIWSQYVDAWLVTR